jgi:hypothetical protein
MTSKTASKGVKAPARQGQAFKDKSKPADIRQSNINAAKGNFCAMKFFFRLITVNYQSFIIGHVIYYDFNSLALNYTM